MHRLISTTTQTAAFEIFGPIKVRKKFKRLGVIIIKFWGKKHEGRDFEAVVKQMTKTNDAILHFNINYTITNCTTSTDTGTSNFTVYLLQFQYFDTDQHPLPCYLLCGEIAIFIFFPQEFLKLY